MILDWNSIEYHQVLTEYRHVLKERSGEYFN